MKPAIFVLDDERFRRDLFENAFGKDHDLVMAVTATEAIRALKAHDKFQMVYLDHDLGGTMTGYSVAHSIASMPDDKLPDLVVVHSNNHPAAMRMVALLKERGITTIYRPFTELLPELVEMDQRRS